MKRFVLDSHFSHTKDFAGLERRAWKNGEEIETVKEVVGRDMRALQSQIRDLEQKMAVQQHDHNAATRPSMADQVTGPSDDYLNSFSNESIAEAYLGEAEECEQAAAKLREQAEDICNGISSRKLVTLKFLDAPNGTVGVETKAKFACCGTVFGSIQDMLGHVRNTHDMSPGQKEAPIAANGSGESTPTHVPARRAKAEKPNVAAEIKASEDDEARTQKPEHGEVKVEAIQADATAANDTEISKPASSDTGTSLTDDKWVPLAVQNMPAAAALNAENHETFTWELIKLTFGGEQWSPGFYFISGHSDLEGKAYWILDGEWEPYLPSAPGQHGAKLTAFFNNTESGPEEAPDEKNYLMTPVFIRPEGKNEYVYFGHYSQKRFSDKLDYDRVMAIPEKVRAYWAEQLSAEGRPEWVTNSLMEHFWPKPTYDGPIATDDEESDDEKAAKLEKRIKRALNDYAEELKVWEKETRIKASCLPADTIMAAFNNADANMIPGLRLWWEYLEFEKYDEGFYNFLVDVKRDPKLQRVPATSVTTPKLKWGFEGKTVKPTNGIETIKPQPAPSTTRATVGTKNHTGGVKPWETQKVDPKGDEAKLNGAKVPNGDMEVAKQLQKDFKKSSAGKQGGVGSGPKASVAPHRHGKQ